VAFEGAGSGSRSVVGFALTSAPLKSPLYPSSLTLTESENMLIMSPHASFVQIVIVGSGLAVLVPSSSAVHRAPARTLLDSAGRLAAGDFSRATTD